MKRSLAMIATIILIITCTLLFVLSRFTPSTIMSADGYVLNSNSISEFLLKENEEKPENIELKKVTKKDSFYSNLDKVYIGENKDEFINTTYPIFSNNGLAIININPKSKLINSNFEFFDSYENFTITGGALYNYNDYTQADMENYFFLQLENSTDVNLYEMTLKTNTLEYIIPLNSIINFMDNSIRYYTYKNGIMVFKEISGIDLTNIVIMDGKEFKYEKLLTVMDKIEAEEDEDVNVSPDEPKEESPSEGNKPGTIKPVPYQKPTVKSENFVGNVYSATSRIVINDPSGVMTSGAVFQLKIGEKLFSRKVFINGGKIEIVGLVPNTEFTIIGSFKYTNEDGKKMENTFYEGKFTTLSMDKLDPIELSFNNGKIYSNKIELKNLKVISDLKAEALKGISKAFISIDNEEYSISSGIIRSISSGNEAIYISPAKLKSNKNYDYEIKFYDGYGNNIKALNNKGKTRTSKQIPTTNVKISTNTVNDVKISIDLKNEDNLGISNYRYIVYNNLSEIISSGKLDESLTSESIKLKNLNPNETYSIKIYGDYNIEDGQGTTRDNIMGETKFTTKPLSSLGYVRLISKQTNITSDSLEFSSMIDIDSVNPVLLELLDSIRIKIKTSEDVVVYDKLVSGDAIINLKAGLELITNVKNLQSKTEYFITATTIVKQGTISEEFTALNNLKSLKTYKKHATVEIINKFTNNNMIDFDVRINDVDGAIETDRVLLEIRNDKDKLISMEELSVNGDYKRLIQNKLEIDKVYKFIYIAEEYNIGYDNSTYESNYILYNDLIKTEEGIYGKLELISLLKNIKGKNLFNIDDYKKIRINGNIGKTEYDLENNAISFTGKNGWTTFGYYMPEYKGKKITISFLAKYGKEGNKAPIFVTNSIGATQSYKLNGINDSNYVKYEYTATLNSSGYIGFLINETGGTNLTTTLNVKDLQIEENSQATSYEKYIEEDYLTSTIRLNLLDTRNEITNDEYYVRVFKNDTLVDTFKYPLENKKVEDELKKYNIEKNKNYRIALSVKIRDRIYDISNLEFNTETEIRSITKPEEISSLHTSGRYIVLNDLDFTRKGNRFDTTFSGEIDFQGHNVIMNVQGRPGSLIQAVGSAGVLKNLNIKYYLDNTSGVSWWYGLIVYNYGTIKNMTIDIESATNVPNNEFNLIAAEHYGSIENFVVNSKVPVSIASRGGILTRYNRGIIKNGYVYGENINAKYDTSLVRSAKDVGTLIGESSTSSRVENVFSLIGVDTIDVGTANTQVGNIMGYGNVGVIRNSYSVESKPGIKINQDPNIGRFGNIRSQNLFYVSDETYVTTKSNKISKLALFDKEFQNKVLNTTGEFIVDEFVDLRYFPQVKMSDSMPNQEWIPIPTADDSDLIDVTSVEVLENNGDSGKLLLHVNNPAAEKITYIGIKNVSTKIVEQTDYRGKSKLIIEVTNPSQYVSRYFVREIKSKGAMGIEYSRTYTDFERPLDFDLYKPISTVKEFKELHTAPTQNYILKNDLDFENEANYLITNTYSGKFDGNGFTIKNIFITSGTGLFNNLKGTIQNLNVNNLRKENASAYGGLIYYASANSVIDNVHVKNISVNATSYIGGIAGYADEITIMNSSVTNLKNINAKEAWEIRIGGLLGYAWNSVISNCYVNDLNIDISNSLTTHGVGGVVAYSNGSTMENIYATGSIKTNSVNTGGIVGNGINLTTVKNAWTDIDIKSELEYVGGIAGKVDNNSISNTLVIGDVYSSYISQYVHRTVGNRALFQNNFAWDQQLLNGYVSGDVYGEELLTTEQLKTKLIYEETINLGEFFDYSHVANGNLPLLLNMKTKEILPGQKEIKLAKKEFSISKIVAEQDLTNADILIEIENPNNIEISGVEFDYLNIISTKNINTSNGKTSITVHTEPIRYLDSYSLNKLVIKENGKEQKIEKDAKVPVQFYKSLEKFEDWQQISTTIAENYRLTNDIDFAGKVNINSNVVINRLEGIGDGYTIKNITLNPGKTNFALIKKLTGNITNVNFDGITINSTSSGAYSDLIKVNFGNIEKVNFSNFDFNTPKADYVAIIGTHRGDSIRDITLTDMNMKGNSYVGTFAANSLGTDAYGVTLNNITITATGNYIGGFIAYKDYVYTPNHFQIHGTNINITGYGQMGGLYGYGGASNSSVKDSTIIGGAGEYIGGFAGTSRHYTPTMNTVTNTTISGNGRYIGGMYGWAYDSYDSFVFDSIVKGESPTSQYVGGFQGNKNGYSVYNVGVLNTKVINKGNGAGGILGNQNTGNLNNSFVYNTEVTATNNAGGLVGDSTYGRIAYCSSNATVKALENGAGGILGRGTVIHSENEGLTIRIYENLVTNSIISANHFAGGLVGELPTHLTKNFNFKNIISADVTSGVTSNKVGPVTGIDILFPNTDETSYIYENTSINGTNIKSLPQYNVLNTRYATTANLINENYYKSTIGLTNGRFDYTVMANQYFPFVRNGSKTTYNQKLVKVPTGNIKSLRRARSAVRELPKLKVYASDVDKINLEFDKTDVYSKYSILVNNTKIIDDIIDKKTFTLNYDFKTTLKIIVTDTLNTRVYNVSADDLISKVTTFENEYAYLYNKKIKGSKRYSQDNFINLYGNYALGESGNIYDLNELKYTNNSSEKISLNSKVLPLYEFEYENSKIKTYYNYSVVDDKGFKTEVNKQIFIKNDVIELIDSSLQNKKNTVLLDKYSTKNISTVLGEDGIIYNLKSNIKYPNNFNNKSIKNITNNINSTSSIVLVEYANGKVVGFDYRSGDRIFEEKASKDTNFLTYFMSNLKSTSSMVPLSKMADSFDENKDLMRKLDKNPIIENNGNYQKPTEESNKPNFLKPNYITYYNSTKKEFEVVNINQLFEEKNEEIITETDKIYTSKDLMDYYMNETIIKKTFTGFNGFAIFMILITGIFISLFLWLRNINFLKNNS